MDAQRTLLVVDDERDLREILSFTFRRKGYKTFEAENAVKGLDIVKSNKIDVVISDIRMPGGDGIQLLTEIKKFNTCIPIVLFITGFSEISLEEAYDKGCEAIFSKPFDPKILCDAVDHFLQNGHEGATPRSSRVETSFQINVRHEGLSQAQSARLLNLGRGGFFVRLTENFPKAGDTLAFRISFEKELVTFIEGEGIVRWVRTFDGNGYPAGCGVEFSNLDDQNRAKICELINYLKTTQYIPRR